MEASKKHSSLFLLLVAICFSFNIHGFTHIEEDHQQEENANCELCIITKTEEKVFVGLVPSPLIISFEENLISIENKNLNASARKNFSKKLFKSDCFNKPPPESIL